MHEAISQSNDLLTYSEVAKRLKVTNRHVRTIVAAGDLPPIRFSPRCVRFDPADVDAYIQKARNTRFTSAEREEQ